MGTTNMFLCKAGVIWLLPICADLSEWLVPGHHQVLDVHIDGQAEEVEAANHARQQAQHRGQRVAARHRGARRLGRPGRQRQR
jgi:hypothetical protein